MSKLKFDLPAYADIFSTEEQRQSEEGERVKKLQLDEIEDFQDHPFTVEMDEDMASLVESIRNNGLLEPVMVRPHKDGHGYELIAGHRRKFALQELGIKEVDAIVRDLDDDEAKIMMADSNLHREHIYPSERGYAYRMKLEAMKHQGKQVDETCDQYGYKSKVKSVQTLAELVGESKTQVQRYIRLTFLIKPIQQMVDERHETLKMGMVAAVELSYLSENEQEIVYDTMTKFEATPNLAQAKQLRNASKEGILDSNYAYDLLSNLKANQRNEKLDLNDQDINQYFPNSYTAKQKKDLIVKLLATWRKNRDKNKSESK